MHLEVCQRAGAPRCSCRRGGSTTGILGDGTTISHQYPMEVAGGGQWLAVQVMDPFACGLAVGGGLYCWGSNA